MHDWCRILSFWWAGEFWIVPMSTVKRSGFLRFVQWYLDRGLSTKMKWQSNIWWGSGKSNWMITPPVESGIWWKFRASWYKRNRKLLIKYGFEGTFCNLHTGDFKTTSHKTRRRTWVNFISFQKNFILHNDFDNPHGADGLPLHDGLLSPRGSERKDHFGNQHITGVGRLFAARFQNFATHKFYDSVDGQILVDDLCDEYHNHCRYRNYHQRIFPGTHDSFHAILGQNGIPPIFAPLFDHAATQLRGGQKNQNRAKTQKRNRRKWWKKWGRKPKVCPWGIHWNEWSQSKSWRLC